MKKALIVLLSFALSIAALSCGQQHGKNNKEMEKNSAEDDAWFQGEWKNDVYGDIVDIYPDDSIRFLKNGLVFSKEDEEDWMWDFPKPETIDDLDGNILSRKKFLFKIGSWHESFAHGDIEALLFEYEADEYPFDTISTYLGIDRKKKQLYYYIYTFV